VHTLTLTERKIALHSCKWVQFQKQIIDLGVSFNCGDREMRRPMKRLEDWVEIFYPRYLMRCVEIKDTVLNFLCLMLKKGSPVHPLIIPECPKIL
jgi:hypothetical protein